MKLEIKDSNSFLRAKDVKEGDIVVLLNEGEVRDADFGTGKSRKVVEFEVEHNKINKTWTTNKTTLKNFVKAYGDDTNKWIGKKVKLSLVKVNVRGEIKDSIVGFALQEKEEKKDSDVEYIKM